ncbi:hypothetical protein RB600_003533 [Gaeumannomyces tritici]
MSPRSAHHGRTTSAITREAREDQPLLRPRPEAQGGDGDEAPWRPPPGLGWIQAAIQANAFLYGFDATITASTYAVISSDFGAANAASWLTTSYTSSRAPPSSRSTAASPTCSAGASASSRAASPSASAAWAAGSPPTLSRSTSCARSLWVWRRGFDHHGGMYQAMQNGVFGFGSVPVSAMALLLGYLVVENPAADVHTNRDDDNGDVDLAPKSAWRRVDILGSLVLVFAVSVQLLGLSLGGNELPWSSPWATPIIRLHLLRGSLPILTQTANMCLGLSAYAYLFMLPLFFQVVLEDSATTAGVRLAIPSLATPLGGLVTGLAMARWGKLLWLMRLGALVMVLGNALVTSLEFSDSSWKYIVYIFPANPGQGIVFPSILFTALASFEHSDHAVTASTIYLIRSLGHVWGGRQHVSDRANHARRPAPRSARRYGRQGRVD